MSHARCVVDVKYAYSMQVEIANQYLAFSLPKMTHFTDVSAQKLLTGETR